jgi:hypothetical protein
MLSRFFHCQWLESNQHDWTNQVRIDLEEMDLPVDLEEIEKKSIFSWKNLVKKKAKELELRKLLNMKVSKSRSKMKNLNYDKLHLQDYLINLDVKLAKNVFRYRTRMIQFDGNFNGQEPVNVCPLCGLHSDHQHLSFQCPVVVGKIVIEEDYENIFGDKVSLKLAKTLQQITKLRQK